MTSWIRRMGWFVLIWVLSVLALAVIAYGIRAVIFAG